jgi:hypothetical protein
VPIKASSFYLKPTLKKLNSRFVRDKVKKKELVSEVRPRVSAILSCSKGLDDFQKRLKKSGLFLVLNRTETGEIYGTTYVDHLHRVGIKGSDLGKDFGANSLSLRFGLSSITKDQNKPIKEQSRLERFP